MKQPGLAYGLTDPAAVHAFPVPAHNDPFSTKTMYAFTFCPAFLYGLGDLPLRRSSITSAAASISWKLAEQKRTARRQCQ